jgi:hypothetical protein
MSFEDRGRSDAVLLLFVMLAGISGAAAEKVVRQSGKPESSSNDSQRPQLLNADTNPTLRFPIARMGHMNASISFGWLDISRNSVRYHVEQPLDKSQDSFEVSRQQIRNLDFQGLFLIFSNPKMQRIFYLPPSEWESLHSGIGIVSAAEGGVGATQSIERALQNFDFALSLAGPAAPATPVVERPVTSPSPPPKPAAPAAAPNIVLVAPAGAGGNHPVEQDQSPLVIRGAVMDSSGMPVVTINGSPANMRPQSTQAAEFWSEPLPLQPGDNRFQISAANAARVETQLTVLVHYTPKAAPSNPRALDKQEILGLLHGGVPASRVVELIKERGIKFQPTADDLNVMRAEGGSDELIQAIQQAAAPAP